MLMAEQVYKDADPARRKNYFSGLTIILGIFRGTSRPKS